MRIFTIALIVSLPMALFGCGLVDRQGPGDVNEARAKNNKRRNLGAEQAPETTEQDAVSAQPGDGTRRKPGSGTDADEAVPKPDACNGWPTPGKQTYAFTWQGKRYDIQMSIPQGAGPRRAIVMLHGGKGGAASIIDHSKYLDRALKQGYIAAAPEAERVLLKQHGEYRNRWRTGQYDDDDPNVQHPRDDVRFLDAFARHLKTDMCVDKVMAMGFSNGGSMGHRWLCEGTELDALANVAGTLQVAEQRCTGKNKPVLEYIGTKDPRYHGPAVEGSGKPSAPDSLHLWSRRNGCKGEPEITRFGDTRCETWTNCRAPTRLCTIRGLGHVYPKKNGPNKCDMDASEDAWKWFNEVL